MVRPGQAVAVCALALLTIGVVMVNSAGMSVDPREPLTIEGLLLSKSTVYAGLAIMAMGLGAMLPIRRLLPASVKSDRLAAGSADVGVLPGPIFSPGWFRGLIGAYVRLWPLWLGVIALVGVLLLVYVPGIERPRNGSHRWITLHLPGLDSIQPSELAKWGVLLLVAWYGARHARRMGSFWLGLAPGLAAIGLVAGVIVIEDLGTGALVAAAAGVMLLAAGCKLWHMLVLMPVPLALGVLAIVTNEYRMHRIESFLNPYLDPQGKGFHMIQSMGAVAGGQIFGRGLGHGLQKFGYLPEDTTDFLFAIVCEELGVAGAAVVLFLLGSLIWAVWLVTRRERVPILKLLGIGVMATIGIQALINLAVVTGLGPTKGIALPLLSSGGTGWILPAGALGLIIAMDRSRGLFEQGALTSAEPEDVRPAQRVPMLGAMAMTAAAAAPSLAEEPIPADRNPPETLAATADSADQRAATDESAETDHPEAHIAPHTPAEPARRPRRTADAPETLFDHLDDQPVDQVNAPAGVAEPGEGDVIVTESARAWLDEAESAQRRDD